LIFRGARPGTSVVSNAKSAMAKFTASGEGVIATSLIRDTFNALISELASPVNVFHMIAISATG
jgi:hypothetical protein